jgi:hypothetical protein
MSSNLTHYLPLALSRGGDMRARLTVAGVVDSLVAALTLAFHLSL